MLLLLTPHNGGCHDEESDIDKDDYYDWSNEGPNEVGLCVQETAGHAQNLISYLLLLTGIVYLHSVVAIVWLCW